MTDIEQGQQKPTRLYRHIKATNTWITNWLSGYVDGKTTTVLATFEQSAQNF
jgi:hypothetical protein